MFRVNATSMRKGRRLITFLLVPAASIRGRRLFKGGVSSTMGSVWGVIINSRWRRSYYRFKMTS